jgi:hypothetical protein
MGQIPRWYKGRLRYCDISGFWYGEREGKLFKQRGLLVDKQNFDTLTDEQREKAIKRR